MYLYVVVFFFRVIPIFSFFGVSRNNDDVVFLSYMYILENKTKQKKKQKHDSDDYISTYR
jgi:hypothetical protein